MRRLDGEHVVETVSVINELRQPSLHDWQHTVLDHRATHRRRALAGPVLELLSAEQVFRAWKGRHPAAAVEPCVPADVVDMEMGAHHEIHLSGHHACRGERQLLLTAAHRNSGPRYAPPLMRFVGSRITSRAAAAGYHPATLLKCNRRPAYAPPGVSLDDFVATMTESSRRHLLPVRTAPSSGPSDLPEIHAYDHIDLPLSKWTRLWVKRLPASHRPDRIVKWLQPSATSRGPGAPAAAR